MNYKGSEEIEEDDRETNKHKIFKQVVEKYGIAEEDTIELAEDGIDKEEEADISISETLQLFEMQQEDGSSQKARRKEATDSRQLFQRNKSLLTQHNSSGQWSRELRYKHILGYKHATFGSGWYAYSEILLYGGILGIKTTKLTSCVSSLGSLEGSTLLRGTTHAWGH